MKTTLILILITLGLVLAGNIKCEKQHTNVYEQYEGKYDDFRQRETSWWKNTITK